LIIQRRVNTRPRKKNVHSFGWKIWYRLHSNISLDDWAELGQDTGHGRDCTMEVNPLFL
jgi:hypothetical protein